MADEPPFTAARPGTPYRGTGGDPAPLAASPAAEGSATPAAPGPAELAAGLAAVVDVYDAALDVVASWLELRRSPSLLVLAAAHGADVAALADALARVGVLDRANGLDPAADLADDIAQAWCREDWPELARLLPPGWAVHDG